MMIRLLILLLFAAGAHAETLQGRVVGITDGDSLTVLVDRTPIKVRLAEIDSPEKKQPFGTRAKQALSDLCFGQQATVEKTAVDRYGRTVARVECQRRDASTEQVRSGMAWVFRRYAKKDSPLYPIEADARAARRGLWIDDTVEAPWDYRARLRKKAAP